MIDLDEIGCSDGNCVFADNRHKMHTNGGCKCLSKPGMPHNVRILVRELRALRKVRDAAAEIAQCPYTVDSNAVPKAWIEANPSRVVGVISCSLARLTSLRKTLKEAGEEK